MISLCPIELERVDLDLFTRYSCLLISMLVFRTACSHADLPNENVVGSIVQWTRNSSEEAL
jgi:hypothetical protein